MTRFYTWPIRFQRRAASRAAFLLCALALLAAPFMTASCAKTEPPPPIVEKTEDPRDALFDILYSANGYTNNINMRRMREFYSSAIPPDLISNLTSAQSSYGVTF